MDRFVVQTFAELESQRPVDSDELVHFTESLATAVIEEYTAPGDLVLDPFAGFGTTLVVAERLGRRPLGIELLPDRVAHVAARLRDPTAVLAGDAREVLTLVADEVALVLTSPPYMTRNDHPEDPLDGYRSQRGDYRSYLTEVEQVFAQLRSLLRRDGHAVVNAANITHGGVLTPLAWDLAHVIGRHLTLVQECYLAWDSQPRDISGDYLLVFRRHPAQGG